MDSTNEMSSVRFTSSPAAAERVCNASSHANAAIYTGFPDPFAVATLGGEQTKTTTVIKRTLNPYWNESFDLCAWPDL